MLSTKTEMIKNEPYRFFFPLGFLFLLAGVVIWIPFLFSDEPVYPVRLHRFLVLNGFMYSFIAGFLMTAVPRFSQSFSATLVEISAFFLLQVLGIFSIFYESSFYYLLSSIQSLILLSFLFVRMKHRKANPPYTFIFLFGGLILWFISGFLGFFDITVFYDTLHYEASISFIVIGIGSRLIPGILGHTEILQKHSNVYEKPTSLHKVIPWHVFFLMIIFVTTYFFYSDLARASQFLVVLFFAFFYWKIYLFPKQRSALTWNIWLASWIFLASYALKLFWPEGGIHSTHALFIGGFVLLTLMVATRVIQSHGPQNQSLENKKLLYLVSFLIILTMLTRVLAYVLPNIYFKHLGYAAVILIIAGVAWGVVYLPFVLKKPK